MHWLVPCVLVLLLCAVPHSIYLHLALVLVAVPAIVVLSIPHPTMRITKSFCLFLGDVSYPIYALHVPIIAAFAFYWNLSSSTEMTRTFPPQIAGCLAFVVVMVAYLMLRIYDLPVRKRLNDLLRRWHR